MRSEPLLSGASQHLSGKEGVRVAALRSHLAAIGDTPPGVIGLDSTYPMSRYLRAFDATVSAAGYNAYHELIRFGVPSLFVPMRRQTDDQHARARYAEESGVGRGVDGPSDPALEAKLDELLDPAKREAMRSALSEQRPGNGAKPAAEWLAGLAASERVRKPGHQAMEALRGAPGRLRSGGRSFCGAPARSGRPDRPPDRDPAQGPRGGRRRKASSGGRGAAPPGGPG